MKLFLFYRERTKKVYSMYSRKPVEEVKQNLIDLQVDYAILEDSWCLRKTRSGCNHAEDLVDFKAHFFDWLSGNLNC